MPMQVELGRLDRIPRGLEVAVRGGFEAQPAQVGRVRLRQGKAFAVGLARFQGGFRFPAQVEERTSPVPDGLEDIVEALPRRGLDPC